MSVNGINPSNPLNHLGVATPAGTRPDARIGVRSDVGGHVRAEPRAQQTGPQVHTTDTAALRPQTPIAGHSASTQSAVPAEAPAGTDPTLWSVLTSEERNFFAKTAALGPLTYSRLKAATHPAPPAARGVRLDVRA